MKILTLTFLILAGAARAEPLAAKLGFQTVHDQTPNLKWTDANGAPGELAKLKGRSAVLHIWASWCASCRLEIPKLAAVLNELRAANAEFLLVSIDKKADRPAAALVLKDLKFARATNFADPEQDAKKLWAWGVPVTYFISSDGRIVARAMGDFAWDRLSRPEFLKFLKDLAPQSKNVKDKSSL